MYIYICKFFKKTQLDYPILRAEIARARNPLLTNKQATMRVLNGIHH